MKTTVITCGIYLYDTLQKKILVCHATRSRWNQWSIPKGLPDEGESLSEAGVRELYEETGIVLDQLHVIARHKFPPVKYQKQNKQLESFLVITDSDLSNQKFTCHSYTENSFPEVDKWKWISLEEAEKLIHEAQQKNLKKIAEFIQTL